MQPPPPYGHQLATSTAPPKQTVATSQLPTNQLTTNQQPPACKKQQQLEWTPVPSTSGPSKQSPSSPEQPSNNTSNTCNPTTYKPTSNYSVVPHELTNPTVSLVQTGNHGSEPPAKHWKKRGRPASFGHEASGNVVKQVREQFVTHTKEDFPVPSTILCHIIHLPIYQSHLVKETHNFLLQCVKECSLTTGELLMFPHHQVSSQIWLLQK